MKSFYEMLEVSPHASSAVIRAAYRCLAQQDHPDKNPDSEDAKQRMSNINRAYAVLSDAAKRKAYDLSQDHAQGICERRSMDSLSAKSNGSGAAHVAPICVSPVGLNTAPHTHLTKLPAPEPARP